MNRAIFIFYLLSLFIFANDLNISIEKINKIAISGDIKKAIKLVEKKIKNEPNSKDLHLLRAKLLYWNKRFNIALREVSSYKKYDQELYRRIYIAWAYNRIKRLNRAKKRIEFFNNLNSFAKRSYDIWWIYIDSLIKQKRLKKALKEAKLLLKKYPFSKEADERVAQLLFWNKRFKKSIYYYKRLSKKYKTSYYKEIKKIKRALYFKKRKKNFKKRNIKKITKVTKISKLLKDPNRMFSFGWERRYFSDNRYKDYSYFIEGSFKIKDYTLFFNLQKTKRYNKNDSKIYIELYPTLSKPQWGFLSLSYSFEQNFFAKYSIGWHHYIDFSNIEIGAAFTISRYNNSYSILTSFEFSYFFNDKLSFKEKVYWAPKSGSYAFLSKIQYKKAKNSYWFIEYIKSNSKEDIDDLSKSLKIKRERIGFGFERKLYKNYYLNGEFSKDRNRVYSRFNLKLSLRYYW